MVLFEKLILQKLNFALYPLATPVSYVRILLDLWPNFESHDMVFEHATNLIGDFYEGIYLLSSLT